MIFRKKNPEHIGYLHIKTQMVPEYRCPNKKCGFGVVEEWIRCPWCGQKLGGFRENKNIKCRSVII